MSNRNFREMMERQWADGKFACIGLDTDANQLPEPLRIRHTEYAPTTEERQTELFREKIVRSTADLVAEYKVHPVYLNEKALKNTIADIHEVASSVPVILDGKYGDGSRHVNERLAAYVFDFLKADAITVNPFVGQKALQPFLDRKDKGIFVLCHTSGPGSGEFQSNMDVAGDVVPGDYMPLFKYIAHRVAHHWNKNGNCGLVVGAPYYPALSEVREVAQGLPILITGLGPQQPDVPLEEQIKRVVVTGKYGNDLRMIFNSSRWIIHGSSGDDFADEARYRTLALNSYINQHR